jgi:hypothetical protein
MRRDLAIHEPLEQPDRAINAVACKPLAPKFKAAFDAFYHGLGNGDLHYPVGARDLSVDNDASLVVDEIVRIISKERINAGLCHPCRLRESSRNFLRPLDYAHSALSPQKSVSRRSSVYGNHSEASEVVIFFSLLPGRLSSK